MSGLEGLRPGASSPVDWEPRRRLWNTHEHRAAVTAWREMGYGGDEDTAEETDAADES